MTEREPPRRAATARVLRSRTAGRRSAACGAVDHRRGATPGAGAEPDRVARSAERGGPGRPGGGLGLRRVTFTPRDGPPATSVPDGEAADERAESVPNGGASGIGQADCEPTPGPRPRPARRDASPRPAGAAQAAFPVTAKRIGADPPRGAWDQRISGTSGSRRASVRGRRASRRRTSIPAGGNGRRHP